MLSIGNKTFMNLQEAVGWLFENNALPFQSTANYVGNTEIPNSTLINPSPAKVRVGSLIFFADSKVSTVIGVTSNSFIVSDQYNDLVDDVVYVSNVAINASGHLIVTLSNGTNIDAGLIKQVTGFSINGSQHLIVSYNDGTTTDLGAIFNGNINISGSLNATAITGDSIIENMSGYSVYLPSSTAKRSVNNIYVSACKNGNKVTFVIFGSFTLLDSSITPDEATIGYSFVIPESVGSKLYPYQIGGGYYLDNRNFQGVQKSDYVRKTLSLDVTKTSNTQINFITSAFGMTLNEETYFRIEQTFLLSENLAS